MSSRDNSDTNCFPLTENAELFELFRLFQRVGRRCRDREKKRPPISIHPEVLQETRRLEREIRFAIPHHWNGRAREVKGTAPIVTHHFHDIGIAICLKILDRYSQRGHVRPQIGFKQASELIERAGLELRFITLEVQDDVAIQSLGDFRDSIRS